MASSGNFAVLNDKIKSSTNDITIGNCRITSSSGGWGAPLTLAANTGKFYVEINFVASDTNGGRISVLPTNSAKYNDGDNSTAGTGDYAVEWKYDGDSNFIANNNSTTQSSVGSWAQGDVAAVAFDLDASPKTVQFYKNNSTIGSAENINTSAEGPFTVMIYAHNAGTWHINAGQDSTFGGNETAGGNADGNGFGDFYYSPPSGFLALCSANLPISDDIDPAQTDDDFPQKQFGAYTYTGNSGSARTVSTDFQADLIWIKSRDSTDNHYLQDSSRGFGNSKSLSSNSTGVQGYNGGAPSSSGAQSVGSSSFQAYGSDWSRGTDNMIAWCWRANGGTTASNTDGALTSTVQANQAAGFSISKYTSNGSGSSFGHGLGAAPDFFILKKIDNQARNWMCWHKNLSTPTTGYVRLNLANAESNDTLWDSTAHDSTKIYVNNSTTEVNNPSGDSYICYAWRGIEGYSKFGTYEGNGSTDGTFVYTGFRPRMVFLKQIDGAAEWAVYDTARDTTNEMGNCLEWDLSAAEKTHASNLTTDAIEFFSNGFKLTGGGGGRTNQNGRTFIFGAWGDVPAKYGNTF